MLRICLLGHFEVMLNGAAVEVDSRPVQALLAILTLKSEAPLPRDQLAGTLWPDSDESNARGNLRHALWRLRQAIGDDYLAVTKTHLGLDPDADWTADVHDLERAGRTRPETAGLEQAVELYRGHLLPGFYEEWTALERDRLEALFQRLIQTLVEALTDEGRWPDVLTWAERWIALGHSPEPAFRALMQAHAALGDAAAMATAYQRCRDALMDDLGVEPSPETEALFDRLASGERAAAVPVEKGSSPAPEPADTASNLPASLTPFFGREAEITALTDLFQVQGARLVTLTGPGGIGKTRLALEAASRLEETLENGAWFVDLAPISDPGLVASVVAGTLGMREEGGTTVLDSLKLFLADRNLLLIMDNFEHLVKAAPDVSQLLAAAPSVRVLATSRERLRLQGEHDFPVGALLVPPEEVMDIQAVLRNEAIQLFLDRARAANLAFEVTEQNAEQIARICRRLEGLPLAIELAAARINLFAPAQLLGRLETRLGTLTAGRRDAPARQQTLRSAFEWSYDLLSDDEQILFNRLGIFSGGWGLEEARTICQDNLPVDVVDGLASLLDKSLIYRDTSNLPRFGMLEVLRELAQEKLRAANEYDDLAARHAKTYAELAAEGWIEIEGQDPLAWIDRFEAEHDNLRAAMRWTGFGERDLSMALQLVVHLTPSWLLRGYLSEGFANASAILSNTDSHTEPRLLAEASIAAGRLAYRQNQLDDAGRLFGNGLHLAESIDDPILIAEALNGLGNMETEIGDYDSAPTKFLRARTLFRQAEDKMGIANSNTNLAWASIRTGDLNTAEGYLLEALELHESMENQYGIGFALSGLGEVYIRQGELQKAQETLERSLDARETLGDKWGMGATLGSIGWAHLLRSDLDAAEDALKRSLALRHQIGDKGGTAWCLEKLAEVADGTGTPAQAARLYGAARALRDSIGSVIDPADVPAYEERMAHLRETLGQEEFEASWARGAATPTRTLVDSLL
jgi:predicted ATPase/DNA-binding SARP family transcriptional activator